MMKMTLYFLASLYSIAIFHLFFAKPAFAYLDPGTGSYILQILIAAVVGALFVIKPFFLKIKTFFRKIVRSSRDNDQAQE